MNRFTGSDLTALFLFFIWFLARAFISLASPTLARHWALVRNGLLDLVAPVLGLNLAGYILFKIAVVRAP